MSLSAHRSHVARRRFQRAVLMGLASSGAVCEMALADRFWVVNSGTWNTGTNWSSTDGGVGGAGAPGSSDSAYLTSTDGLLRTITYNGSYSSDFFVVVDNNGGSGTNAVSQTTANNLTCRWLLMGDRNGGDAQWTQSAGANTVKTYLIVAEDFGATSSYSMSGGSINLNGVGGSGPDQFGFFVGYGGTGSFTHSGGSISLASNVPFVLGYHNNANTSGTYTMTGAGASLTAANHAFIGGQDDGVTAGRDGNLNIQTGTFSVAGTLKVYNSTGTVVNLSGGSLSAGTIDTSGNPVRFNWTGGNLTIGGDNTNSTFDAAGSGSGSLNKTGTGTLTLTGVHTYTGATTVTAGQLRLGLSNVLPDSAAVTVSSPGSLNLNGFSDTIGSLAGSGNVDLGVGTLTTGGDGTGTTYSGVMSGSGALVKNGLGNTRLTGSNTYTGGTTVNGGILQIGTGGTIGSITGNVSLGSVGTIRFSRSDTSTYAGVISGSGVLEKSSAGTLVLTGANTHGSSIINFGTLQIGDGGTTGSIVGDVSNNGTLAFNRSDTVTYTGIVSGSGSLTQAGAGTLVLTGSSTYTGGTTISAGTLQIGNAGTTGSIVGNITNNAAMAFNRSDTLTYAGIVSGSGSLTQAGAGTLVLTGSSTYTGGTTISAGTLQIGDGSGVGTIVGNVNDNGNLHLNRSSNYTFAGVISGSGSVEKSGTGTLTLSGSNTYTGQTTVNAGTISVAADNNLGNGGGLNLIGSTLKITQSLSTPRTITSNGGTIDVGVSSNTVTLTSGLGAGTGSLTCLGNGTLNLQGASSRTGATTIRDGAVRITSGTALGTNGTGSISVETDGALVIDGVTLDKPVTLQDSAILRGGVSAGTCAGTVTVASSAPEFNTLYGVGGLTLSGLTGGGATSVLRVYTGKVVLTQPSTFVGTWELNGTTLQISADSQLGDGGNVLGFFASGGRLRATSAIVAPTRTIDVARPFVGTRDATFETNGFDVTFGNVTGTGTLSKITAGKLTVNHLRTDGLNITGGTVGIAPSGGASTGTSRVATLSLGSNKLDLTDNKLITASGIGTHNGSNYTGVYGMVESGRNGGVWNGNGITTSMSSATDGSGYTMLGVATASEARGIGATDTDTWGGQTVTGSNTLVMYTYGGDANLSGNVDVDDYGQIDFNASTGGVLTGWYNGDFDYNGVQDVDDYGIIDFVVNIQGAPFPTGSGAGMAVSTVPEPVSGAFLAIGGLSVIFPRRRGNVVL